MGLLAQGSLGGLKEQRGRLPNREIEAPRGGRWYPLGVARLRQQLDA